jgi:pantoate--beta-alanine ligase
MRIIESPEEMQRVALELKAAGKTIAFVPTMGFLHAGHLSLMSAARKEADVLVASIFVNPTQFGPNEDLEAYPRNFERDEKLCAEAGVDYLFYPTPSTMYAPDFSVWVDEETLSGVLCGAARPGHFRGVCTVVLKLFHIVQPHVAVFGKKDAQQLRVIRRMVRDLNVPIKIMEGSIVRESDGLALSSRNSRLSPPERASALCLQAALKTCAEKFKKGERSVDSLKSAMREVIESSELAKVDYLEIVDDETLLPVERIERKVLVALAVAFPSARLIDNLELDPAEQ